MLKEHQIIYDISISLGDEAVNWPGLPPYSRELISKIEDGEACNISRLALIAHVGTHVDTPLHFVTGGKNLDGYPIETWILPAKVVNIKDTEVIRRHELEKVDIAAGDVLLFKTNNSISGKCVSGVFSEDYVYMSPEAADYCVEKKVSLVGIDYGTVDRYGDEAFHIHRKLLGNEIRILEGINLKEVPPGRYHLFCLPLKIKGAEGAPARAILIRYDGKIQVSEAIRLSRT